MENKSYKAFFLCMVVLAFLSAITSLVTPFLLAVWSKTGVEITLHKLFIIISILVIMFLIKTALIFLRENFAKFFNIKNAENFILKILNLNYDTIISQGVMNLVEKAAHAVNNTYTYMTGDAVQIWANVISTVLLLTAVFFDNAIIALFLFLLIPVNYLSYKFLNDELRKRSEVLQKNTGLGFQEMLSVLSQTDYLKQCPNYNSALKQLNPAFEKIYGSMAAINKYAQTSSSFISSFNGMLQTICILIVMYNYITGTGSLLHIVVYSCILPLYFSNICVITNMNLNKNNFKVSMDFINFLNSEQEENCGAEITNINNISFDIKEITIGEQSFKFNIKDNFVKGDIIGIKGKNGTGKSTLMKQLLKFRNFGNTSSGIFINGLPISEIKNECVRSLIDYVPQTASIINGTIRDNLFLNQPYSEDAEIKLKQSKLLASVLQHKNFDTKIMDMGANLSGGEKQKLCIARTLYSKAEVLILDEVTANIDAESTALILDTIKTECKNKIVFIISHEEIFDNFANKIIAL